MTLATLAAFAAALAHGSARATSSRPSACGSVRCCGRRAWRKARTTAWRTGRPGPPQSSSCRASRSRRPRASSFSTACSSAQPSHAATSATATSRTRRQLRRRRAERASSRSSRSSRARTSADALLARPCAAAGRSVQRLQLVRQFQTSSMRYQLMMTSYILSLTQSTRLPAFRGYLSTRRAQLDREDRAAAGAGAYWMIENAVGNLRLGADPMAPDTHDNVMYSGWFAAMVGMYASNTGDTRYDAPGSITLRGPRGRRYWCTVSGRRSSGSGGQLRSLGRSRSFPASPTGSIRCATPTPASGCPSTTACAARTTGRAWNPTTAEGSRTSSPRPTGAWS